MLGRMITCNTRCRFCPFDRQLRPLSTPLIPLTLEALLCQARKIKIRPTYSAVQTEHLLRVFLHQLATRRAKILWKSGVGDRVKLGLRTFAALPRGQLAGRCRGHWPATPR